MYISAILIVLAVSIMANVFLSGFMLRYKRLFEFYHDKFHDAVAKIDPPPIVDPYEQVKVEIGYPWDDTWD